MQIHPLHDQVLIQPIEEAGRTESGLYKPENAKGKPTRGHVTGVGPGKRNKKGVRVVPDLRVGDVVHYPMFVGKEVKVDGDEIVIIEESLIVAVEESE